MKSISAILQKHQAIIFICLVGFLAGSGYAIQPTSEWMLDNPINTSQKSVGSINVIDHLLFQKINLPQDDHRGRLVLGGSYTLGEGEVLQGDLVILGGEVDLFEGSEVRGDILIMGGTMRAGGLIEGDILVLGGQVDLDENARVLGSVNMIGGHLDRAPGSLIEGEESFSLPSPILPVLPQNLAIPTIDLGLNPAWRLFWILTRSFLWAAVAVLVTLFLPVATGRVSQAASNQPVISGGTGCLTVIVAPAVLLIIGITIIGIPISLLATLVLLVAWCFGVIAIGWEVGRRFASAFKQDWAQPVAAAVGVFILTIVTNSIDAIIPCVGWLLPFLVGVLGLGAVILTRFGSSHYPTAVETKLHANNPELPDQGSSSV